MKATLEKKVEKPKVVKVEKTTAPKSPIKLESQKKVIVKKEFPPERRWGEFESIAYFRYGESQKIQDKLLLDVYGDSESIEEINPIVLKVFRGGKLKFSSCRYRFTHLGMTFYACEHNLRNPRVEDVVGTDKEVTRETELLFEEEQILSKYNPIVKDRLIHIGGVNK